MRSPASITSSWSAAPTIRLFRRRTEKTSTPRGLSVGTFARGLPIAELLSPTRSEVRNTGGSSVVLVKRPVSGRRKRPRTRRTSPPANAVTKPIGVISKTENGVIPSRRATPSMRRFVDVPSRVQVPPRIVT